MRSLPPPRKSKARALRRFLHKLYRIISLQFLLKSQKGVVVKRRRTPFHFTSRKYKVKQPRGHGSNRLFGKTRRGIPVSQIALGEADVGTDPIKQIQFRTTRRLRGHVYRVDRRYVRRIVKKVVYKMYAPRRYRNMKNLNIVVDI